MTRDAQHLGLYPANSRAREISRSLPPVLLRWMAPILLPLRHFVTSQLHDLGWPTLGPLPCKLMSLRYLLDLYHTSSPTDGPDSVAGFSSTVHESLTSVQLPADLTTIDICPRSDDPDLFSLCSPPPEVKLCATPLDPMTVGISLTRSDGCQYSSTVHFFCCSLDVKTNDPDPIG
jgi:hypothetical protein